MNKSAGWKSYLAVASIQLVAILLLQGCDSIEISPSQRTVLSPPTQAPKHIILFIGDGMQLEHEIAGSRYLHGADFGMVWHGFPYQGYVSTWDVDTYNAYAGDRGRPAYNEMNFTPSTGYEPLWGGAAPYPIQTWGVQSYLLRAATDSASAATAIATGVKTNSGNISWREGDPPGGAIETIAEKMRSLHGAAIGVVSTVPFNHATPAAFVSHNTNRNNYGQIADEIIQATRPEVVIGAGHPGWGAYITWAQLDDIRNSPEYVLIERVAAVDGGTAILDAANIIPGDKKLFGVFGGPGGDFEPPVPADNPGFPAFTVQDENPSLAEATEAALTVLGRNPRGFFLMAEQGDIDWANHANNYSGMIGCMWDLDSAVRAAVAFVDRPGDNIDWSNTLIIVTADHANSYMRLTDNPVLGAGDLPEQIGSSYPGGEVTYAYTSHTNELVTVYAKGDAAYLLYDFEGLWYPGAQIIDNTQIFFIMEKMADILQ